mgnify:CR=1 FL=1
MPPNEQLKALNAECWRDLLQKNLYETEKKHVYAEKKVAQMQF